MFLQGLLIGLSIAAPVGPIGVLCIRRTLAFGWKTGFISGLGAASADAIYGSIAGFGLTFISAFLVRQQELLRLAGGLFLCYLGVRTLLARPAQSVSNATEAKSDSLTGAYLSTFLLTLTNPLTILSFAAIFAGLGLASGAGSASHAVILVIGVFIGSALWWLLLTSIAGLFRQRITPKAMLWINRISGLIILGFGIVALVSLLKI
jgi:threonine/homoserine/homoserine lactone efflux protein